MSRGKIAVTVGIRDFFRKNSGRVGFKGLQRRLVNLIVRNAKGLPVVWACSNYIVNKSLMC